MSLAEAERLADERLGQWVGRGRAMGVLVGLCRREQMTFKGFGSSGTARPLDADSILEIGSITKAFTGTLLAQMAEDGDVSLDDPVAKYVPVETRSKRAITLLDLATQTSRLPRSGRILIRQSLRNRREPFAAFTVDDLYATVMRARPRRGMGERFGYSNIGFGLLGHALGRAAGRSYADLIIERVCQPLGLTSTFVEVPAAAQDRLVVGHRRGGVVAPPLRIPTLGGAGALRSTVRDMLQFLRATLHPERTSLPSALAMAVGPHRRFRGGKVAIGLGWLHMMRRGERLVFHNGGTIGFGSFAILEPESDAAVVLLSNSRYLLRSGRDALAILQQLGA